MKSLKRNVVNIFIAFIGIFSFTACSSIEDETQYEIQYEIGYLEPEQSISQIYELIGEKDTVGYMYEGDILEAISGQQTVDGGWVAWSNGSNMYVYTEKDVGVEQIRFYLANELGELQILH